MQQNLSNVAENQFSEGAKTDDAETNKLVEAVLKALTYRWEVQSQDPQNPNRFPKPRSSVLVTSTRDAYYRRLVEDTVTAWPDRGVYCAQRDGYSVEDFMRMMVKLWGIASIYRIYSNTKTLGSRR